MKRIKAFFRTDIGILFAVAVIWQLFMTLVGFILAPQLGLLGHMSQWDAGWYKHIIEYGYSTQGSPAAPAFYPLFPTLVASLSTLSFGLLSLEFSALILNTAAVWLILVAIWRILATFKVKKSVRYLSIAAFLAFPSAFFLHTFYSESIFIAAALWAYVFALKKKWWAMGILLAVLTSTRLPSLLFIGLCGLEFMRARSWNIKKIFNKHLLWFLLAPIGFILYGTYLYIVRGDFLAMFSAYEATNDWTYQIFNLNIFATLYETILKIASSVFSSGFNYEIFINYALPLLAIAAIAYASIYLLIKLKKDGVPLFAFGLASIILFTLNSNVVSVHRYSLACIVLFIAIALYASSKRAHVVPIVLLIIGSTLVQLFIYSKFIQGIFAG